MPWFMRSSPALIAERKQSRSIGFAAGEALATAPKDPQGPQPEPDLGLPNSEDAGLIAFYHDTLVNFLRGIRRLRTRLDILEQRLLATAAEQGANEDQAAAAEQARLLADRRTAALLGEMTPPAPSAPIPVARGHWPVKREWLIAAMVFFGCVDAFFAALSFEALAPGLPAILGGAVFGAVVAILSDTAGQRARRHGWRHPDVLLSLGFLAVLVLGAAALRSLFGATVAAAGGGKPDTVVLFLGFAFVLGGFAFAIVELAVHSENPRQYLQRHWQSLHSRIMHRSDLAAARCAHQHALVAQLLEEWESGFTAACTHHGISVPEAVQRAPDLLPPPPDAATFWTPRTRPW